MVFYPLVSVGTCFSFVVTLPIVVHVLVRICCAVLTTCSAQTIRTEEAIADRCIQLLALPPALKASGTCLLLDIGAGTGLSAAVAADHGCRVVGVDIAQPMLDAAADRDNQHAEMMHMDIGHGLPFRPGVFDGAISVSALQWLCVCHRKSEVPKKRIGAFFRTLYNALARGARAVLQVYAKNEDELMLLMGSAEKTGFITQLVTDFPSLNKGKEVLYGLEVGLGYRDVV